MNASEQPGVLGRADRCAQPPTGSRNGSTPQSARTRDRHRDNPLVSRPDVSFPSLQLPCHLKAGCEVASGEASIPLYAECFAPASPPLSMTQRLALPSRCPAAQVRSPRFRARRSPHWRCAGHGSRCWA